MVTRRKNGADEMEFIVILAALGGLGYFIYKAIPKIGQAAEGAGQAAGEAASGMAPLQTISLDNNFMIPGTGQTVAELVGLGYTTAQIQQMLADASAQYGTPVLSQPVPPPPPVYYPESDVTGWLTGS